MRHDQTGALLSQGRLLNDHTSFRYKFRKAKQQWQFYAIILLPLIYIIIFAYVPMPGILMAFQRFSPIQGFFRSPWIGLSNFTQFLSSPSSRKIILNTFVIGVYSLVAGFPVPIILAVALNEVGSKTYKKIVQMVTYAPYFISTVVIVGMIYQLTDLRLGLFNRLIVLLGGEHINFMGIASIFPSLYVWSGIWQTAGYSAIIYLAALAGVSKELQEAAIVDGATRLKRIWHIDLPFISPQIIIIFIYSISGLFGVGFEKIYLMQNPLNISTSEIIATFVYKVGMINFDYGFSTAVGLLNSVVAVILLVSANYAAKRLTETSLW